jgi:7,8-dihydropterin-6-yl-methyl-4-(beta-D-ribofuranosyl)aminobenzene 5'-phosphate synthase
MPRPRHCRRIGCLPQVNFYKPRGVPLSVLQHINLTVDELEAIRLADPQGLYQEQAAQKMNVSRQTFGRIIESAHRKIADALVNGKALSIEGGSVECGDCNNTISITTLVDNNASKNLASEHGLSFWVEYGNKRVLFDTGQTDIIVRNAKLLLVDLALTDAIIVSHGHYDHTGGLAYVLDVAPKTTIYLHTAALKTKFTRRDTNIRDIGMSDFVKDIVRTNVDKKEVVLTEEPTEVSTGLYVTGRIPRVADFEDIDSSFFVDKYCRDVDELPDDQAMFFDSPKGLVILLGCAHSGVVNTLHYVVKMSGHKRIHAVLGGMHLLNASKGRIERTISVFREYDVQKIGMAHCTGKNAVKQFQRTFPDRCFICSAGTQINLGDDHNAHIRV